MKFGQNVLFETRKTGFQNNNFLDSTISMDGYDANIIVELMFLSTHFEFHSKE